MKRLVCLFIGSFLIIQVFAQVDTSIVSVDTTISALEMMKDTAEIEERKPFFSFLKEEGFSPKKAAFYSVVFPGGGQVYNRQYWKAPLVLGGVGTAGYFIYFNTIEYRRYRDAYRLRVDGDPNTLDEFYDNTNATEEALIEARDQHRKWLEQSYIGLVLVYSLQVLEAYTAAHLKNFDIDENISLQWQPNVRMQNHGWNIAAFSQKSNPASISAMEFGVKMQLVKKQSPVILGF